MYADDLVLLSLSDTGLQRCLDKLQIFANNNNLTISIKKSKTIIFNKTGKLIKHVFTSNGKKLEPVQNFCYLGFDIKASGTVTSAIATLNDKAKKAMRPLQNAIARFSIPAKTAIKLFHAYISPIILYNAENWAILSEKKLKNFDIDTVFTDVNDSKANVTHRKFLKYIMGVTPSCPTLAVMGDTGEIPLLLKGFKMLLKYWYRVTNLHDNTLAKKALLENVQLRTNWITTIEKLMNCFKLTDSIRNINTLNTAANKAMNEAYIKFWKHTKNNDSGRLEFYKSVKNEFGFEAYLNLPFFKGRKAIAKLRGSDHGLEIEKGRHKKIPRDNRLCRLCNSGVVESEIHFLQDCTFYDTVRQIYDFNYTIGNTNLEKLGQYLVVAFEKRKDGIASVTQVSA